MSGRPPVAAGRRHRRGRRGRAVAVVGVLLAALVVGAVVGGRWVVDRLAGDACRFQVGERTEQLSPEQAANAATIAMVAVERDLPPRAVTIALATALQESKLRNLDYGHADSLGLFQQRPSQGWGSKDEVRDPVVASNRFYDALERVPDWEHGVVTEVAQAVQRSAYPRAYANHEARARVLASVLTGQTPAGVGCRVGDPPSTGSARDLLTKAENTFAADGRVQDGVVVIDSPSPAHAWATAQWAVTHAAYEDITKVQVADRVWRRDTDPWQWSSQQGGAAQGTTVRITVG